VEVRLAILMHLFLLNIALRFFSLQNIQTSSAVHPASFLMDTKVLALGVKQQGREDDHSPPSGAGLRICRVVLILPVYACMV
jgi:hypothetical protein